MIARWNHVIENGWNAPLRPLGRGPLAPPEEGTALMSPYQIGYRPWTGFLDHVSVQLQTIQDGAARGLPAYVTVIDAKAYFDRISRAYM